ncbi:MAG: hypothetical protein KF816_00460 [Melioribacteraceae bacterium]|nr:hypothetical protein [Melioribacteraceae bacterium]
MKILINTLINACIIICFVISSACAQADTAKVFRITLKDNTEIIAKIINQTTDSIFFATPLGIKLGVDKKNISDQDLLNGYFENDKYVRIDPNRTRLFFAPTGRMLKGGEGYISDYWLFFPFISMGITDFFTLSGGMTLFPGANNQLFYIAPRIGVVQSDKYSLSGGIIYASAEEVNFGIVYGVTSIGSKTHSFTLGIGYGFSDGELAKKPVIVIGGEAQVSNSLKLISENWIPPGSNQMLISFGLRFFGDYLAADFGLITSSKASGGFPFLPWLGFCYNF